jgi:cell division protein FtsL
MNFRILINMVCIAVLAIGVYLVKYSVQDVQRNVGTLKSQLASEKESLHLLNAEWSYLNRPDRLRELADRHLMPIDSRQIEQVAVLPVKATLADSASSRVMVQQVSSVSEER